MTAAFGRKDVLIMKSNSDLNRNFWTRLGFVRFELSANEDKTHRAPEEAFLDACAMKGIEVACRIIVDATDIRLAVIARNDEGSMSCADVYCDSVLPNGGKSSDWFCPNWLPQGCFLCPE